MSSWISNGISKILFPNKNKNVPDKCDQCGQKFKKYDELIAHARHVHHDTIVKCKTMGENSYTKKIDYIMFERNTNRRRITGLIRTRTRQQRRKLDLRKIR